MCKEIVIDFETMDWGIRDKLGPGFPWGGVSVLGMAWAPIHSAEKSQYCTNADEMVSILNKAEVIVAHNAQYEAGILVHLGVNIDNKKIYCTKLLGLFVKSNRMDNTLDGLAKTELGAKKLKDALASSCIERGLIVPQKSYYAENKETQSYKNACAKVRNQVWDHLDQLQEVDGVVEEYANVDVDITKALFLKFQKTVQSWDLWAAFARFSKLIQVTTLMRAKGIRVDVKRAFDVKALLRAKQVAVEAEFWAITGVFNYGSDKQVKEWALDLGLPPQPDVHGKLGFGKSWVDKFAPDHEHVRLFGECKRYTKAIEFCDSVIKFEKNGRVYPEMTILGARTGRFTSRNPNIQQIPGRDKEIGPLMRSIYLPEEGEKWHSLDYSGQEDRLRVHFAALLKDEKALQLVSMFIEDPNFDTHEDTKIRMNKALGKELLTRGMAKTQNHGISYGMGVAKQARSLGVSETQARKLKELFFKVNPYVKVLFDVAKDTVTKRGFLKTVGGRRVHVDEGFEYKALSALIQGSALDQTAEAMILCYENGIIPLCVVHDEINISGDEMASALVKDIMENATKLEVPTVTDTGCGDNWAEAK